MGLSLGAKIAVAFWLGMAAVVWLVADRAGTLDEFDRQVKARCEMLGHEFARAPNGALVCSKKQLARV